MSEEELYRFEVILLKGTHRFQINFPESHPFIQLGTMIDFDEEVAMYGLKVEGWSGSLSIISVPLSQFTTDCEEE